MSDEEIKRESLKSAATFALEVLQAFDTEGDTWSGPCNDDPDIDVGRNEAVARLILALGLPLPQTFVSMADDYTEAGKPVPPWLVRVLR